jgi:hypothetical protein
VVMMNTVFWDITPCSPLKGQLTFRSSISPSTKYALSEYSPVSTLMSRLPSPLHPRACDSLDLSPLQYFPVFSLNQQNRPFSWPHKLVSLPPIGSLGVVSFCPMAGQWEGSEIHSSISSCFLYNPKLPASRLLGSSPASTLVSCSAYLNMKMEAICSSET